MKGVLLLDTISRSIHKRFYSTKEHQTSRGIWCVAEIDGWHCVQKPPILTTGA
jgi:hypothetical protein